jgi:hypothetical protein
MVLSFLRITKKCFKSLLIHNKANNGIVFLVDHQKNCLKRLPVRNKTHRDLIFSTGHQKCVKIEMGLAHFPMHAYVASVKHVADGT